VVELLREDLEAMTVALDRCRRKFGMERVAVHPIVGTAACGSVAALPCDTRHAIPEAAGTSEGAGRTASCSGQ